MVFRIKMRFLEVAGSLVMRKVPLPMSFHSLSSLLKDFNLLFNSKRISSVSASFFKIFSGSNIGSPSSSPSPSPASSSVFAPAPPTNGAKAGALPNPEDEVVPKEKLPKAPPVAEAFPPKDIGAGLGLVGFAAPNVKLNDLAVASEGLLLSLLLLLLLPRKDKGLLLSVKAVVLLGAAEPKVNLLDALDSFDPKNEKLVALLELVVAVVGADVVVPKEKESLEETSVFSSVFVIAVVAVVVG